MSNHRLKLEAGLRPIYCIIVDCHPQLHLHVAHHPKLNPARHIVSVRDNPEWRPSEHPQSSWTEQVDSSRRGVFRMEKGLQGDVPGENPIVWCNWLNEMMYPPVCSTD